MPLTLINNSSDNFSYLSGAVVVPAGGTLNVDSSYWFSLLTDLPFIADLKKNNFFVSDGIDTYSFPESEELIRRMVTQENTSSRDSDGAMIVRNKAAKKGWTFCSLPIEFETSRLSDTLYSQDVNGNPRAFVTMKSYDAQDNEVTTPGLLNANYATIVKTVIDFEPPYDYEIIGGDLRTLTTIVNDMRLWIIAAPDVPAPQGSKEMGGGINLRYLSPGNVFSVDGRVSKYATYHPVYHTNKIRMVFKYPAGTNESIMIVIQFYKQ
jgi:hypothetical protein